LSDVSSKRETAVAAVDSLSLSRQSFRTLPKRVPRRSTEKTNMKLDFIGTLFDGEIMVFIPCMNQEGQMLVLRSHGEWTKTRIMMRCQTTRQPLEKGKSSWKEMKIGGKKWSSWQRATAKAKDARSPV
jgi:hypothetical protein